MFKRNILIIAFCFGVSVISGWESYANENAESLYNQAKSLYREKEYHQSMALLQEIVGRYPDSEVSVKAKGAIVDCYRILKNYDLAIEYGNKYLKDYPDNDFAVNVELIIARSLLRKDEYDEAESKYEEFINKHKGSDKLAEAYYFLGNCYTDQANKLNPIPEIKLRNLDLKSKRKVLKQTAMSQRTLRKQALNCYEIVINDYPNSRWAHSANYRIGDTYYDLYDYEKAIPYYKKYIEKEKSKKYIGGKLYYLGVCYERLGEIEEAKKLYNRIIKDLPNTKWEKHAKKALKTI